MKVLFVAANPSEPMQLRVYEEFREIQTALRGSPCAHLIDLKLCPAVRPNDLRRALHDEKPEIVHFSGHSTASAELVFENDKGEAQSVSSEAISNLFSAFKDHIRVVVLNSCYSVMQADEMVNHIDCVIGMSAPAEDQAAIEFSVAFYEALAFGDAIEKAYRLGCDAPSLNGLTSDRIPRLREKGKGIAAEISVSGEAPSRKAMVEALEDRLHEREEGHINPKRAQELQAEIDTLVKRLLEAPKPGPGQHVAGAELIKPLASGNFATVWLSRSLNTGEDTATKIFHVDKLSQGLMVWRFRRGIRAMERFANRSGTPSSIVKIRDTSEEGLAFTMDYLTGGDLQHIDRKRWTLEHKIRVMIEICRAVKFAHDEGVIHRDIKPANIVLNEHNEPVLTDFDIADLRFATTVSVMSGGLGTPVFAAPEQLEDSSLATERSDVYSLGRLLYYFLLERSPGYQIEGDPSLDNLSKHPPELVSIVRRATQFKSERRYPNVGEMIRDLELYGGRGARIRAQIRGIGRWIRVNSYVLIIFSLLLCLAGSAAVYFRREAIRQKDAARQQEENARLQQQNADIERQYSKKIAELASRQDKLTEELNAALTEKISLEAKIASQKAEEAIYEEQLKNPRLPKEKAEEYRNALAKVANDRTNNEELLGKLNDRIKKIKEDAMDVSKSIQAAKLSKGGTNQHGDAEANDTPSYIDMDKTIRRQ